MSDLVLFDASSIAYHRHFARLKRPEASTAEQWINDFVTRSGAERFCIVGDSPRNWRMEIAPEYKQHRSVRPVEVTEMLDVLHDRDEWTEIDGYEADDTIAVLVAEHPADRIVIVANDKDLHQLVTASVLVFDPVREISYDLDAVYAKWDCAPERLRTLLALTGDKSDNIAGVPGIGPKRAAQVARMLPWPDCSEALAASDRQAFTGCGLTAAMSDMIVTFRDTVIKNYELVGLKAVRP